MAAPKGNKYTEKWTLEKTIELFDKMLQKLIADPSICFLGTLAVQVDQYREIVQYLAEKFEDSEEVFLLVKRINSVIESRLVEKGLSGHSNATITIFTLKNHYGWADRQEHTGADGGAITLQFDKDDANL